MNLPPAGDHMLWFNGVGSIQNSQMVKEYFEQSNKFQEPTQANV